ncbi:MAG: hypothetical protein QXS32_08425 [Candidatus Nezhaarchaeales archaeon]
MAAERIEALLPENWVTLRPGERKVLHFYDHAKVEKVITDPVTGKPKVIEALNMFVDEEDGAKVHKVLSVASTRLAQQLLPYIEGRKYVNYVFVIEKPMHKFAAPYVVEVRPRS